MGERVPILGSGDERDQQRASCRFSGEKNEGGKKRRGEEEGKRKKM